MNWDYLIWLGVIAIGYYVYETIMRKYGESRRFKHLDTTRRKH